MIYFDNSATTKVCEKSAEKAMYMMTQCFGNPSSLHSLGFSAEKEISSAREIIAKKLGCESKEIYFTSGGTESNNMAIFGAVESKKRFGKKIVTTALEHPSVLEPMKQLEKMGFEVVYLKPDEKGEITKEAVEAAIDKDTILVSIMAVNNETGLIMPLEAVGRAMKRAKSQGLFHVDNVQGFGKISLNIKKLGIHLMTVSGHKIHAPKGVGGIYINQNARIVPRTFGGGQEKSMRVGTESAPLIAAFGQAVKELPFEANATELQKKLRDELGKIPEIKLNSPENNCPYILNFSCGRVRGETMLHFLEQKEIYISTGSACSKAKPSHVLSAMNLPKERVESSIRVSFSRDNTLEEVEIFVNAIKEGLSALAYR